MLPCRRIRERIRNWWDHGPQDRPCLHLACPKPGAQAPSVPPPPLDRYWLDADVVLERQLRAIDGIELFGEAVPWHYPDFGAPAMALMLGAEMDYVGRESLWAKPRYASVREIGELAIDLRQPFHRLVWEVIRRSMAVAGGRHVMAPYCLGSPGDTLFALLGAENFLYDLVTEGPRMKEVLHALDAIWADEFARFGTMAAEHGLDESTGWHAIWTDGTTFPIQEDLSCMISDDLFREFSVPFIRRAAERMDDPFYHLDGPGALHHLDTLCAIPELKVIQWVPGAGHERLEPWYDVVRKVLRSGKSCQVYARADEVAPLARAVGSDGLFVIVQDADRETALRLADAYGLEPFEKEATP